MVMSGAFSLMTFTAALAEAFAAVGLSTLVPNLFVQSVRALGDSPDSGSNSTAVSSVAEKVLKMAMPPAGAALGDLRAALAKLDTLDLLVPKTAKLHAEFEFHASEAYKMHAEAGVMIELVTVKAGYEALYQTSSSNKVTLDVDFATVAYEV